MCRCVYFRGGGSSRTSNFAVTTGVVSEPRVAKLPGGEATGEGKPGSPRSQQGIGTATANAQSRSIWLGASSTASPVPVKQSRAAAVRLDSRSTRSTGRWTIRVATVKSSALIDAMHSTFSSREIKVQADRLLRCRQLSCYPLIRTPRSATGGRELVNERVRAGGGRCRHLARG